ncbi:hypothetical protein ABPG77_002582 [Micractinium sp. CCAP 211/92]
MPSLAERLYHAARDGDLPSLQACLAAGADPNERRGHGRETTFDTALHAAALYGHAACVRALLAAGANPAIGDSFGVTPLHEAALKGHVQCVEALLAGGASPSAGHVNGWTPVHCSACQSSAEVVQLLLAAQPGAALAEDYHRQTPLMVAVDEQQAEPARCLLSLGALPAAVGTTLSELERGGAWALPLYAALAARRALAPADWARVPAPCAGLGAALPAVLERSPAEAALLVQHLPQSERQRLHTAALCLARAQQVHCTYLPPAALGRILALAAGSRESVPNMALASGSRDLG